MTQRIPVKPHVRPHVFVRDPDTPGDPLRTGHGVCATCRLPGSAGDAHHDPPDAGVDGKQRAAHDD